MCEFINNLTSAQATLISSMLSVVLALSVIFINKWIERSKDKKEKYDAVKKYANPIIFASEQLAWRIKEILEFNGAYLLPYAPENGFFKYKFDSTVYRLCAVLGWIQAAKKEQSYIEGIKVNHHKKIQTVIIEFQKKLADGSHVEVSILNDLIRLFNIKFENYSENEKALIGVELEKIVFSFVPDNVKRNALLLPEEKQIEMLKKILNYICTKAKQSLIKEEIIREKRVTAINEVSREYCWIYRDWQSAIGDSMLKEISGANRRFDVIGFAEFQKNHENNPWFKKVDGLFTSLDVSVDDRFDTRVQQLKQLFSATLNLIEALKEIIKKQETIPDNSFDALKTFNEKINGMTNNKKKRLRIRYE